MNKFTDVICIDDKFTPEAKLLIPNRPVKDKLYQIRDVFPILSNGVNQGEMACHLVGITNPKILHDNGMEFEPSFNIKRFRSLIENRIENYESKMERV